MKLEVGKYYRTRDGRKVRVVCNNRKALNGRIFVGLVEGDDFEYTIYCEESGRADTVDCDYDLVSEWIDKPEFDWSKAAAWHVAVAKSHYARKWYAFDKIPEFSCSESCFGYAKASVYYSGGSVFYAGEQIPDKYAPTWEGDARDSLIIRPGYEVIS